MSFLGLPFFALCFFTVLGYYLLPRARRWYILLAASLVFYLVSVGPPGFVVALALAVFTWGAALRLEAAAADRKRKRLLLYIAVIVVAGALVLFKASGVLPGLAGRLLMPLGLSYYSLSLIGYLADVYYKKQTAERSVLRVALYTFYFPKIVEGPISKFRELGPRLMQGHDFDWQRFCFGLQRMLWGYFKKLAIADRAAPLVQAVFGDLAGYNGGGAVLVLVTLVGVVRHYCDFSGYMDIVIGLSQMMGIELAANFRRPFFSRSAAEFWRRWHITLGVWFKDYVYMPLVIHPRVIALSARVRKRFGKRAGKAVQSIIPLAVVWPLTGLWHGTGWDYLLWGVYWGTLIILANTFAPELKKAAAALHIPTGSGWWQAVRILRTFGLFTGGLLISTFAGHRQMGTYFAKLFGGPGAGTPFFQRLVGLGLTNTSALLLFSAIAVLLIAEIGQERGVQWQGRIARLAAPVRWVLYALTLTAMLLWCLLSNGDTMQAFGYARF